MKKIVGVGIFGFVVFLLLSVTLYDYLNNGKFSEFTFESLLGIFKNAPKVDVSWSVIDLTISEDWGSFNFLRNFINLSGSIIEFILFIVGLLWQGLNYVLYFFNQLFRFSFSISPGAGPGAGGGGGGIW